jgi:hypothetical protein
MLKFFKSEEPAKDRSQWEGVFYMHELQIWQRDVTKYDQFMRKMLAMRELGDLPYEVWQDLYNSNPSEEFKKKAGTFGTKQYTYETKLWCLKYAMAHYVEKYMALHTIEDHEEARNRINTILNNEVPVSEIWPAAKMKQKAEQKKEQKTHRLGGYNPYPVNGRELHSAIPYPVNGYGY